MHDVLVQRSYEQNINANWLNLVARLHDQIKRLLAEQSTGRFPPLNQTSMGAIKTLQVCSNHALVVRQRKYVNTLGEMFTQLVQTQSHACVHARDGMIQFLHRRYW